MVSLEMTRTQLWELKNLFEDADNSAHSIYEDNITSPETEVLVPSEIAVLRDAFVALDEFRAEHKELQ